MQLTWASVLVRETSHSMCGTAEEAWALGGARWPLKWSLSRDPRMSWLEPSRGWEGVGSVCPETGSISWTFVRSTWSRAEPQTY